MSLTLPSTGYVDVARLVVGGAATRLSYGFEAIDDMQLAVESALRVGVAADEHLTIHLAGGDAGLKLEIGPFDESILASLEPDNGETIGLARRFERLVDTFETVKSAEGVRLTLLKNPAPR